MQVKIFTETGVDIVNKKSRFAHISEWVDYDEKQKKGVQWKFEGGTIIIYVSTFVILYLRNHGTFAG